MKPIIVEHRRTLFSELSDVSCFEPGITVADVVARLPVPAEFATHGAVYIKRGEHDQGHMVERRYWHLVRPKPGTALFVSCIPRGGGGGKNTFAIIAAIALIALTAFVGGGGLALLGPSFSGFGAGTIGATVGAAAISVAGAAALTLLTRPPGPGGGAAADAEQVTLGVAGIAQNPIAPFRQVPAPLGRMRISPPLLARPFTTVEQTDQYVHVICGVCGPAQITNIKINETDAADFPATDLEIETREGWIDPGFSTVLLHFNGEDGSTEILDDANAARVWTANGNAQIDTADSVLGGGSLLLDGTGDFVDTTPDQSVALTDDDWTVALWFNLAGGNDAILHMLGLGAATFTPATAAWNVERQADNTIRAQVSDGTTNFTIDSTTQFTTSINPGWHHVGFVRSGDTLRLFVDGQQEGGDVAFSGSVPLPDDSTLSIGTRGNDGAQFPWNGRIDEVGISVGVALWTSNFTPPTREAISGNAPLTLIRESGFEETINLEMGKHRLESDQTTLIQPFGDSFPSIHTFRTLSNPDRFRVLLGFPQGLIKNDGATQVMAFRMRLRRVGETTWRNLPEMHIEAKIGAPFRQAITMFFGGANELELVASTSGQTPVFVRFYARNPEWTADTYFNDAPSGVDTNSAHTFAGTSDVFVVLDPDDWPAGEYDVSIQRSSVRNADSGLFSGSNYDGGLFTFNNAGPPVWTLDANQGDRSNSVAVQSYATFRNRYPIAQPGLALIAVKAKNIQINSISAEFEPYIPVPSGSPVNWDTIAPSSNPAALVRWVRTGLLNKRPSDPDLSDGLEAFYDYCVSKGLECSAVVTEGSVEQAAALAANVGDALIRESDRWGVVIDRDRSADGIGHLFGAHNMTAPLVIQRKFVQGTRGIVAQFTDASRDYSLRELARPVFDDGVSSANSDLLVESVPYDGYSDETLVKRRARLDLRRTRLRATRYSWECHQEHLVAIKGDLVGVSHDILAYVWATGRVVAFTTEPEGSPAGSPPATFLRTVTLNTDVEDIPAWDLSSPPGIFDVPDWFLVGDVFTLSAPAVGLQVRLADNTIAVLPVASVSGRVLTIEGDVDVPAGFERTLLAAVGPRLQETRRVLITNVLPRRDHFARIEAVDEAPAIHSGL